MKLTRLWTVGCWILLAVTQVARAQTFVPLQAPGSEGAFAFTPVAGVEGAPLFNPAVNKSAGTVGGRAAGGLGEIIIGFDYIRPFWTSRDFILAVPAANAGSFPLLGDIGHVDNHFALAPRVNYKYDVSDDFAIKATGSFMNLKGNLDRTLTPNDGSVGILTATSTLTVISANLPEITTRFTYPELFGGSSHYNSTFDALTIDLGIGTRYSSVGQTYTGKLSNNFMAGMNETQRFSTQSFTGVGLTSSLNFGLPLQENARSEWNLFTNMRGSILVGENTKESSLTVNLAGMPGVPSSIKQSKTEYMPVGEVEMGVEWVHLFGDANNPVAKPSLFSVRMGVSGQFWGNAGPLSAGSGQGFATSNLFLVGAHVMVGVER